MEKTKEGYTTVDTPPAKPDLYILKIAETIGTKHPYIISMFDGEEWDIPPHIYPIAWCVLPKTNYDLPF